MKDKSIFIEFMGDSPTMRVMDYLMGVRGLDFSLTDIADNSNIGRATLYRILDNLIRNRIIIHTRYVGRAKLFKLNIENEKIKKLIEIDDMLMIEALKKKVSEMPKNKAALVDA